MMLAQTRLLVPKIFPSSREEAISMAREVIPEIKTVMNRYLRIFDEKPLIIGAMDYTVSGSMVFSTRRESFRDRNGYNTFRILSKEMRI